jgi:hypothetical protein
MTIISAVLSENWIAVSSDSLRTTREEERRVVAVEDKLPKIAEVKGEKYHGAISWCGFAGDGDDMLPWFEKRAKRAGAIDTAQAFAEYLTTELNTHFKDVADKWKFEVSELEWIALHFTVFEWVDEAQSLIPEIFYIHNVTGDYKHSGGSVICQRHSRFHVPPKTDAPIDKHGEYQHRIDAFNFFRNKGMLIFNNPKPSLFSDFLEVVRQSIKNELLDVPNECYRLATDPIRYAAHILREGALPESYWVGGAIHSLLISKDGEFCWPSTIVDARPVN